MSVYLEQQFELTRISIEAKIDSYKFFCLKWLIGLMIVQTILIVSMNVALIKLL